MSADVEKAVEVRVLWGHWSAGVWHHNPLLKMSREEQRAANERITAHLGAEQ